MFSSRNYVCQTIPWISIAHVLEKEDADLISLSDRNCKFVFSFVIGSYWLVPCPWATLSGIPKDILDTYWVETEPILEQCRADWYSWISSWPVNELAIQVRDLTVVPVAIKYSIEKRPLWYTCLIENTSLKWYTYSSLKCAYSKENYQRTSISDTQTLMVQGASCTNYIHNFYKPSPSLKIIVFNIVNHF